MKRYTREHQWIELDGDIATIGITAFAAEELGELSYVELPAVGKTIAGGDPLCVVESVKAASDVFMPVTGTIREVNAQLEAHPELVNDSPEGDGWLCRATGVSPADLDALMDLDAYRQFIQP
ncbi:MAG: glycine cleavage system protein GcvH [Oligosphaeraceae bacterium]